MEERPVKSKGLEVVRGDSPPICTPPDVILHIVGNEDATSSFPCGTECLVDPLNQNLYQFEGLHLLEHRSTGKRLAKHIQVQYDGKVRAFSNDRGDVCKEFFIDINSPAPEWFSIGRVSWMFAKCY